MTNFNSLPPEVNVSNIRGPGSKPIRIAQTAWDNLGKDLQFRAEEWRIQVAATRELFAGKAAGEFVDAATQYYDWLNNHAGAAYENAENLGHAAHIYDQTVEGMVPTAKIAANRGATLLLKATNVFGQSSTKIAELWREYEGMWAQNAEMMNTYQSSIFDIIGKVERSRITPAPLVISSSSRPYGGSEDSEKY